MSDGLLGITARGTERVRLRGVRRQPDGLLVGDVALLGPERAAPIEPRHTAAIAALQALRTLAAEPIPEGDWHPDDAGWVACRLAELLPASAVEKQQWLEIADSVERLDAIMPVLSALRPRRRKS